VDEGHKDREGITPDEKAKAKRKQPDVRTNWLNLNLG